MQKVLIIGGSSKMDKGHKNFQQYVTLFANVINQTGKDVEVFGSNFDLLEFVFGHDGQIIFDAQNDCYITDYDLVIFRGKIREYADEAAALSRYLAKAKIAFFNDYSFHRSSSKLLQASIISGLELPQPRSLVTGTHKILEAVERHKFDFPLIVKDTYGAHGDRNFLAKSPEDIEKIQQDHPDIQFIVQEFVPNNGDYRLLCIAGQKKVIHRQAVAGSHLNNTSQGGSASELPLGTIPQAILDGVDRLLNELAMTVAGVDILVDNKSNKHYFLEVNSQPQLATGALLGQKERMLADYFKNVL